MCLYIAMNGEMNDISRNPDDNIGLAINLFIILTLNGGKVMDNKSPAKNSLVFRLNFLSPWVEISK